MCVPIIFEGIPVTHPAKFNTIFNDTSISQLSGTGSENYYFHYFVLFLLASHYFHVCRNADRQYTASCKNILSVSSKLVGFLEAAKQTQRETQKTV